MVVTKVWHTYLGYERTLASAQELLANIKSTCPRCRIALLIHWPRCRPEIPWMRCDDASVDAELPLSVRNKPLGTWRESWRALEELYSNDDRLDAIGVSNFDLEELRDLVENWAKIKPHLVQQNVWTYVFDPEYVRLLEENKVHFQAYNVLNGILLEEPGSAVQARRAEAALGLLRSAAPPGFSDAQIVVGWLVSQGVSVVPRASQKRHVEENANPWLPDPQDAPNVATKKVRAAVEQLLRSGANIGPSPVTILREAAQVGDIAALTAALTQDRADPNFSADHNGWNALHEAARANGLDALQLLLSHGADVNARTNAGKTALDIAKSAGHSAIVDALIKHGAHDDRAGEL